MRFHYGNYPIIGVVFSYRIAKVSDAIKSGFKSSFAVVTGVPELVDKQTNLPVSTTSCRTKILEIQFLEP